METMAKAYADSKAPKPVGELEREMAQREMLLR
jgi:hypothetical protein